jgi:hypothetical protein
MGKLLIGKSSLLSGEKETPLMRKGRVIGGPLGRWGLGVQACVTN